MNRGKERNRDNMCVCTSACVCMFISSLDPARVTDVHGRVMQR